VVFEKPPKLNRSGVEFHKPMLERFAETLGSEKGRRFRGIFAKLLFGPERRVYQHQSGFRRAESVLRRA
jgi:hypothetical protein